MKHTFSVLLAWAWLMAAAAPAAEKAAVEGAVLLPLGVADRAGTTGFFRGKKAGVDAVDLKTGRTLWQAKGAGIPLIVHGNLVLVESRQGHSVRVVGLETATGKRMLESEAINLPEWAAESDPPTRRVSFQAVAWVEEGELLYQWEARTFYAGGAAPSPEVLAAAEKSMVGVSKVHLKTGKVTDLGKPVAAVTGRELENGTRKFSLQVGQPTAAWHVPRKVRATDAASGKVIWEISVAPDFQPPPPP